MSSKGPPKSLLLRVIYLFALTPTESTAASRLKGSMLRKRAGLSLNISQGETRERETVTTPARHFFAIAAYEAVLTTVCLSLCGGCFSWSRMQPLTKVWPKMLGKTVPTIRQSEAVASGS